MSFQIIISKKMFLKNSGHVIALVKPVQPSTADLREEHELVRLWWQEYKRLCGDEEKVGMERMVVLPWPEVGDWEDDVERVGGRKDRWKAQIWGRHGRDLLSERKRG